MMSLGSRRLIPVSALLAIFVIDLPKLVMTSLCLLWRH